MTTLRIFRVLVPLALCMTLIGCGGASQTAGTEASGEAAGSATVAIADLAYSPADVEVAAGDTVTWTNDDDAPHTVTFDDDALTDSGELSKGDTYEVTFDTAGSYSYVCAIHPDMKATVTVQ